jgi:hypothetical protein
MKNTSSNLSKAVRYVVVAMLGMGIVASPAVNAKPKPKAVKGEDGGKLLLVSPADLPELARQNGEAMLLHETGDGRTFLYIEQNHGARLAIFDVSDPSDIRQQGMVQLDAQGVFDFASAVGEHAELVRFRDGQKEALLDLHKAKAPAIQMVQELKLRDEMVRQENSGGMMALSVTSKSTEGYQPKEKVNELAVDLQGIRGVPDVTKVRAEVTNDESGTTFLLTADGLYVVRRPDVEVEYAAHQDQFSNPG